MSLNLRRIGLVAARDYVAVITSRAFLVGLLVMPVMVLVLAVLVPRLLHSQNPQVTGEVAVIDPTFRVAAELQRTLVPAEILSRRSLEAARNPAPMAAGPIARAAA